MLNCIYHPTEPMRVVEDVERDRLIGTGLWFDTPNDAKQVRTDYERRIREGEKPRGRPSKRKAEDV